MILVPAGAASNTKSAAGNDASSIKRALKRKKRLKSRFFCARIIMPELFLFFFTDIDRGNTEGKLMEMNVAEAGFGDHAGELLL